MELNKSIECDKFILYEVISYSVNDVYTVQLIFGGGEA